MDNGQAFAEIQRSMGRVESKVEAIHDELYRQGNVGVALAVRVDELESDHDKLRGGWAALSALAAVVAAGVSAAISWIIG